MNNSNEQIFQVNFPIQGQIKDSWKGGGGHMFIGVGVHFADLSHLS